MRLRFLAALLATTVLAACGGGGGGDGSPAADPASPAQAETPAAYGKSPAAADLVSTPEWGSVPANQVVVVLAAGSGPDLADAVATALDGTIVGEVAPIALYQIETGGTTVADLDASLQVARATDGVDLAFPNAEVVPVQLTGSRCSPLTDPAYLGANGDHYDMIGVQGAWDVLRAAGIHFANVRVGVVDSQVTTSRGELSGPTSVIGLEAGDLTGDPPALSSHGTDVTQIIAASVDNGGVAGVAGVLGDAATVSVTNIFRGESDESVPAEEADPDDPTVYVVDGVAHTIGALVAIQRQVDAGATIINASFGPVRPDPSLAPLSDAYRRYLERLAEEHPEVLIVAAAGNEETPIDGHNYGIQGHRLPNLVTVGAVETDGTQAWFSNPATGDGEVSLMAPGVDVPVATGANGAAVTSSGTSFSTPMVTAAAALLRATDPSLTAAEIKQLLVDTARARPGGPPLLRVDEAVLRVVNADRERLSQPPLTLADVNALVAVGVRAVRESALEFAITATLDAVDEPGTDLGMTEDGDGAIVGATTQGLAEPGSVVFGYAFPEVPGSATITVTRLDNQACSTLALTTAGYDGRYEGSFVFIDGATYDIVLDIVGGVVGGSATSTVDSNQALGLVCRVTSTIEPSGTIDDAGVVHDGVLATTTTVDCGLPTDGTYESSAPFTASFQDGGLVGEMTPADPMLGGPYPFTLTLAG